MESVQVDLLFLKIQLIRRNYWLQFVYQGLNRCFSWIWFLMIPEMTKIWTSGSSNTIWIGSSFAVKSPGLMHAVWIGLMRAPKRETGQWHWLSPSFKIISPLKFWLGFSQEGLKQYRFLKSCSVCWVFLYFVASIGSLMFSNWQRFIFHGFS